MKNLLILLIILLLPNLAIAEIYKSVDENGRVIFTDKPTVNAKEVEVDTSGNNANGLSESAYSKAGDIKPNKPAKQKSVVMYSTSWCGYCKKARKHMQSKGIKFKEYDIEKSASANKKHKKLGGSGVPFFVVGKKTMGGFNPTKLEAMVFD